MSNFQACLVEHVPQTENADTDMLSRLAHEAPEYISKVAQIVNVPTALVDTLLVAPVGVEEEN